MYCRQFLLEGLLKGDKCIFVSTDLSKMQFNALFSDVEKNGNISDRMEFINPCDDISLPYNNERAISGKALANAILSSLQRSLEVRSTSKTSMAASSNQKQDDDDFGSTSRPVRLVIDSMTHTLL